MIATKQVTVPTAVEAAGDKSLQTIHNNTHSLIYTETLLLYKLLPSNNLATN